MEPDATFCLTDEEDEEYEFHAYPIGTEFPELPAVYAYTKEGSGLIRWRQPIYIGETGDLSTRFDSHHKADCAEDHGATHIAVCVDNMDSDVRRLWSERMLVAHYKPPCND